MKKILFLLSFAIMLYSCNDKKASSNPFFAEFDTEYGLPPFDKIKVEHYMPAFEEGMKQESAEVDAIVNNTEAPTFENTIVALEQSGKMLKRVSSVFFAISGANSDSIISGIEKNISPILTEHSDNINLNAKLFERIKVIYEDTTRTDYTTEQKKLIEKYYKNYVRSGILLDADKQERLRAINKELSELSTAFGQNLLADTDKFELVIEKQEDLAGLPADVVAAAASVASKKGLEGKWIFTTNKPSWEPFLKFADNRELREKLYRGMFDRCNNGNENDNNVIVEKLVKLRIEKANLLGYNTFADYVLEDRMAKTPDNVMGFLNNIWEYALPQAKKEAAELTVLAKKETNNGSFKLESWDWWYYAEKLRKEKYDLNEEELKPYFECENVRDGLFDVVNKLYGLTFKRLENAPIYQEDVQVYSVIDADGSLIGTIYMDFYARSGAKRNGAWMGSFQKQDVDANGNFVHPIIYNVENFPAPVGDQPSLLTLDQVETMFHEFGHALHGLLSKCNYYSLSGTAVNRDFVELPSQVMEHWSTEPQVLKQYAKHYQTGEVIPDALIEKMQKAGTFNQGFVTTELVAAAILDMKWHTLKSTDLAMFTKEGDGKLDVQKFEKDAMNNIGLISEIIPRYRTTYFSHIFSGGYSAGYYSYLWSEVLDADAYEAFVEAGDIFDQKTAKLFRENVLSKGGSDDPMTLYKNFRGAEPNPKYLLKNRGFVK